MKLLHDILSIAKSQLSHQTATGNFTATQALPYKKEGRSKNNHNFTLSTNSIVLANTIFFIASFLTAPIA